MDINNISEDGVTTPQEFTEEEKKYQYSEPEVDPIDQNDLPQDSIGRKLTKKQIAFCRYYVATGDVNRSATMAGYGQPGGKSLRVTAKALLLNQDVKGFIRELSEKKLINMGYSKDQMLKTLTIIANQDIKDYMTLDMKDVQTKDGKNYRRAELEFKGFDEINEGYATDEDGFELLDDNGLRIAIDTEKTKAIKSVKYTDSGKVVVDFYDKMDAIKTLGKMLGINDKEKIEVSSTEKVETAKATLLDKLIKKFGDEPEVAVPAEDNEYHKQKVLEKKQAELFNDGLVEEGEGNE